MKVNIHDFSRAEKTVLLINVPIGRLVRRRTAVEWKFEWAGPQWMSLTYEESSAVLDAVKEPLVVLNVAERLLS